MKKQIRFFILLLIILAALFGAAAAAGWFASCRSKAELPQLAAVLARGSGIACGETVDGTLSFTLPLCMKPSDIRISTPPGTVLAGTPRIIWKNWRFSKRTWQIDFALRPLRPGKTAPGTLVFTLSGRGSSSKEITAKIPAFEVSSTATGAEKLALASAVPPERTAVSRWYWLLLLLIPAAVVIVRLLRRPKKPKELTEWEKAVRELTELRQKIDAGEFPPEQAFIGLTELVRRYLERRFDLPVTRSTAQEFISILERFGKRFPADSRPFLREFIEHADMVKFAKEIPENALIQRSAASAEEFISRTRPESEVKNV